MDRFGTPRIEPIKQIDFSPIKFDGKNDELFDIIAESVAKVISKDGRTSWNETQSQWVKSKDLANNKSSQLHKATSDN